MERYITAPLHGPVSWPAELWRWRWIHGGLRDFWVHNPEFVGDFIKKHQLRAVEREHLLIDDLPFPGGLRIAHLHFKGELFHISDEQWKEFSRSAVEGFREKLSRAGTVSFDQLMDLSEAIDPLG